MPEGHTIHRHARDQAIDLVGKRVGVASPQGRFDVGDLAGKKLLRIEPYGKHLVYVFGGRREQFVHVHLGLFGRFFRHVGEAPAPRATTRMRLAVDQITLDLVGPTACERLTRAELDLLLARLGTDPLRPDADLDACAERVAKRRTPIGAALLDQSLIAGIGNVYRAEILFLHGVHPSTPASQIPVATHLAMLKTARQLLRRGVELGRIVTVSGATKRTPKREALYVYKRAACKTCGEKIATLTVGARTIYFCPACQSNED